jgi:hypothetical protein
MDDVSDDDDAGLFFHARASPTVPMTERPHLSTCRRCPCCCNVLKCVFVDCDIDGKHEIHMQHAECTCEESRV